MQSKKTTDGVDTYMQQMFPEFERIATRYALSKKQKSDKDYAVNSYNQVLSSFLNSHRVSLAEERKMRKLLQDIIKHNVTDALDKAIDAITSKNN